MARGVHDARSRPWIGNGARSPLRPCLANDGRDAPPSLDRAGPVRPGSAPTREAWFDGPRPGGPLPVHVEPTSDPAALWRRWSVFRDLRIYRKNSQPPRGRLPSRAPASASPDEALAGLLKSQADRPRRSRAPRHFSAPRHFRAPRLSRTSIRLLLRKIGRQPRNQPRRCVECVTGAIPAGTKVFPSGSACHSALEGLSNSNLYYYSNI